MFHSLIKHVPVVLSPDGFHPRELHKLPKAKPKIWRPWRSSGSSFQSFFENVPSLTFPAATSLLQSLSIVHMLYHVVTYWNHSCKLYFTLN